MPLTRGEFKSAMTGMPAFPANWRRNCSPATSLAPNPSLHAFPANNVHPVSVHTTASIPASSRHLRMTCMATFADWRESSHRIRNRVSGLAVSSAWRKGPGRSWQLASKRSERESASDQATSRNTATPPACACETSSRSCASVPKRVCRTPGYWMLRPSRGEGGKEGTPAEGLPGALVLLHGEELQGCHAQVAQVGQAGDQLAQTEIDVRGVCEDGQKHLVDDRGGEGETRPRGSGQGNRDAVALGFLSVIETRLDRMSMPTSHDRRERGDCMRDRSSC